MKHQLYDILTESNDRLYKGLVYDAQCHMYYWPESNGFVTDDQIESNHWVVIESGYYE